MHQTPARVALVAVVAVALPGCDLFNKGKDLYEGLTNPLVAQGIVLGVEAPENGGVLDGTGVEEGTAFTVFLADAASAGEIENAPVAGANVTEDPGDVPATDAGDGSYSIEPGPLTYQVGQTFTTNIVLGEDLSTGSIVLPQPAEFDVPDTHAANSGLTIDLSGQGFNSALVVVISATDGLTWDNRPETAKELYDFSQTQGDAGAIDVPASAFPVTGAYAVGVAGMVNTRAADLDGMNTALSNFMAGKMVFDATVAP